MFFSLIILHSPKSKRLTWGKRCHFALRDNSRSGKVPTEPLTDVEMVKTGLCLWGLSKLTSITHTYLSVSLSISGISKMSSFNYHTLAFEIYYYQTLRIFLKKKKREKKSAKGKIMRLHFSKKDHSLKESFWKLHWHNCIKINGTESIIIMCLF